MKFEVKEFQFSSGERLPVLFYAQPFKPVKLPFLYITLDRRHKPVNTLRQDIRVLHWFYVWCDQVAIDIECRLTAGHIPTERQIAGSGRWLRALRNDKIIGRIGHASDDSFLQVTSYNQYMAALAGFLLWCARHYIPHSYGAAAIQSMFDEAAKRIEKTFDSLRLGGKGNMLAKGLSPDEKRQLLQTARPGSPGNPFKPSVQLRNYLILRLLLETGMRNGELCGLYVEVAISR